MFKLLLLHSSYPKHKIHNNHFILFTASIGQKFGLSMLYMNWTSARRKPWLHVAGRGWNHQSNDWLAVGQDLSGSCWLMYLHIASSCGLSFHSSQHWSLRVTGFLHGSQNSNIDYFKKNRWKLCGIFSPSCGSHMASILPYSMGPNRGIACQIEGERKGVI